MTHLQVSLGVDPDGLRVVWRLTGVRFESGQRFAQLPLSIAGAPTIELAAADLAAVDDSGALPLVMTVESDADSEPIRTWRAERATVGPVEVSYLARPITDEPGPTAPPIDLRRQGTGLSGAVKCFLVLPAEPADLTFEVRWEPPTGDWMAGDWMAVSTLGEGLGRDGDLAGAGLESLRDTYLMCGDLAQNHHREGDMSTWWLTPPGFDVAAFTTRLETTYQVMAETFDVPAHPYRVFLRAHPHRGANASAHPASFVMASNPAAPLQESKLYETIAHELVHEWVHLDGPAGDVTWFVEGAADYYSLVLPLGAGILQEDAFLHAVNMEARTGYANPQRHLTLAEAQDLSFSDFLAHRLPYTRGMFYLADLDTRLHAATAGIESVDSVVKEVVRRRRDGHRVEVKEWCARVDNTLHGNERQVLEAMVFTGTGRPGPGTFAPRFTMSPVQVPVLDVGFDPSTFHTRRVQGLVPGGAGDRAGLEEGDTVELPSYTETLALNPTDVLNIQFARNGETRLVTIPLGTQTTTIPQWQKPAGIHA